MGKCLAIYISIVKEESVMTYQAHLFIALTIGFIGILFCIFMYQSNKIKQAQIFFFLTIAMMAFWMYVATGYIL